MRANIETVSTFPQPSTVLEVTTGRVAVGSGANFVYRLLDAQGNMTQESNVDLTSEQYESWTGSDQHVVESVAANIGVTITSFQ